MTNKEINEYYEGLECNCINNYGGYTKEQVENHTEQLLNDDNDEEEDDGWIPWWETEIGSEEVSDGPEDNTIVDIEFDYDNPYDSYPMKVVRRKG